ncbi:hypothetical protein [Aquimarina sp. 2201CG14-23]|uniref:hypothetical protein n=1 Tax=Aquimarina mycalae TaxID=3040073 RepID=UPI0024782E0B|nr:hypothetical protein [Aquimarina sp. 2201CG14-23]MDH7447651.1 hypothetical protein [Aquimarina sp. 2201CG14-23]
MSNTIKITQCDNQLVLFAIPQGEGNSYQLCNIKSGNFNSVDVNLQIEAGSYSGGFDANGVGGPLNESGTVQLPAGEYTLVYAGLNWGGPYNFDFTFNGKPYILANDPKKPLYGVIWSKGDNGISFTV